VPGPGPGGLRGNLPSSGAQRAASHFSGVRGRKRGVDGVDGVVGEAAGRRAHMRHARATHATHTYIRPRVIKQRRLPADAHMNHSHLIDQAPASFPFFFSFSVP
jgi:hypothetical protein